jgi:hypothetical protein
MSQAGSLNESSGPSPPDVPIDFVTDAGTAIASLNVINIFGGTNITTSATGNTITINATSTGFNWNSVTSVSPLNPIQIVAENGYICDGSSLVTFLLPLAPLIGDTFIIISNTSRFQINENGSQVIAIGTASSTAGSGNAASNSTGDEVEFVYVGGNIFRGFAPQGVISLN